MSGSLPPGMQELIGVLQNLVRATYQAGQTDVTPAVARGTSLGTRTGQQWQYRVIALPLIANDAEAAINALATDGWTLFAVTPTLVAIFQRRM